MAMKCCTKLETAKERCPIVFQGHSSNFKVTWDKTSPILTQIGHFQTIGRSQLSNPSDLPWFFLQILALIKQSAMVTSWQSRDSIANMSRSLFSLVSSLWCYFRWKLWSMFKSFSHTPLTGELVDIVRSSQFISPRLKSPTPISPPNNITIRVVWVGSDPGLKFEAVL